MARHAMWLPLVLATGACGGIEYRDTTASVDANPLCVSNPDQPNQPPAAGCEREQSATWNSGREGEKVDFGGGDDDR